jgi:hypothetical protein
MDRKYVESSTTIWSKNLGPNKLVYGLEGDKALLVTYSVVFNKFAYRRTIHPRFSTVSEAS